MRFVCGRVWKRRAIYDVLSRECANRSQCSGSLKVEVVERPDADVFGCWVNNGSWRVKGCVEGESTEGSMDFEICLLTSPMFIICIYIGADRDRRMRIGVQMIGWYFWLARELLGLGVKYAAFSADVDQDLYSVRGDCRT